MAQREITFSYYVVMVDYGRRGLEAIVKPDMTRRATIEWVREKLGDGDEIAFIHYVTMNDVPQNVTAELIAEASQLEAA